MIQVLKEAKPNPDKDEVKYDKKEYKYMKLSLFMHLNADRSPRKETIGAQEPSASESNIQTMMTWERKLGLSFLAFWPRKVFSENENLKEDRPVVRGC